jgi:lactoylglutathione lyase
MNERIVIDPKICHGRPVIRGTRLPVSIVVASLAGGMSFDEVQREYGISVDDIRAALKFAGDLIDQEEHHPLPTLPVPDEGFLLTHFLVVSDQDRSREFYKRLFGATVVHERDPVMMKVRNSWLILNIGGGPTDDKPTVMLTTPPDHDRTSAFLNVRVADIAAIYKDWTAKGAEFLTEPKDHVGEIRAYVRDPDGHLIEVGQTKASFSFDR